MGADPPTSSIALDEEVILFPAAAYWQAEEEVWRLDLHAWVFEPEYDSRKRAITMRLLRRAMGLETDEMSRARYQSRMRYFLVDNERGEDVVVRLADQVFQLPPTLSNGHTRAVVELALPLDSPRELTAEVMLEPGDTRRYEATVYLIPPTGLSVVSDVDDTIKLSHVLDRQKLLESTFLKDFVAVPGMPARYQVWHGEGAYFHYLTSSPWQLFPVLDVFLEEAGYPGGTFAMRQVRLKDRSLLNLVAEPFDRKLQALERWFAMYPRRSFILVGDSGEQDPEVYAEMARLHPEQVQLICIRAVRGESRDDPRWQTTFADLPAERWELIPSAEAVVGDEDFQAEQDEEGQGEVRPQ